SMSQSDANRARNWIPAFAGMTSRSLLCLMPSAFTLLGSVPILTHNACHSKGACVNYWPLLGIAIVVVGFARRLNPALVVVVAAISSGLLAGKSFPDLLAMVGRSFVANRALLILVLTLPTIGLLERAGLRERAHSWVAGLRRLTFARLLIAYLGARQI